MTDLALLFGMIERGGVVMWIIAALSVHNDSGGI